MKVAWTIIHVPRLSYTFLKKEQSYCLYLPYDITMEYRNGMGFVLNYGDCPYHFGLPHEVGVLIGTSDSYNREKALNCNIQFKAFSYSLLLILS